LRRRAALKRDYLAAIEAAGFKDVKVVSEDHFSADFIADAASKVL